MQTTQANMLQSLRTVEGFLEENGARLAGVVQTGARQKLQDAIAELSGHVSAQTGNTLTAQGLTGRQRTLKQALLRDHMAPISRIARAELPQTPEVEPLKMPRGNPGVEKLAAAAYGMATAAAPYGGVFTAAGLPADFIVRLERAADAMVVSLSERSQTRGKRSGATTGLKAKLTTGRRIVHVLDAFVRSALIDDPSLLSSWNTIKRVQRSGARSASDATSTSPASASATAPAQASGPTPVQ